MRREAYIGANEVNQLVGKWQTITGAVPWQSVVGAAPFVDITGADVSYNNPWWQQQVPPQHHHHHHRRPWWLGQAGFNQGGFGQGGFGQNPYVRDHRRAELEHRAYVMGDPVALGALSLMGADPAAGGPVPHPAALPAGPPIAMMPPLPPPPMPMPPVATPVTVAPPAVATPEVPPDHPAHPDHHLPQNHPHHPGHPHHPNHRRYRATGWAPAISQGPQGWGGGPEAQAWPYSIPPRNLLVDRPGPTGADRVILPMSSGVNILPNTSAQITSRPQNYAFRPERVIISGSQDWVINDIKVGNMSQFSQSGDVPGEMFGATTIDGFVKFTTCQTAMDFVIVTTFVGASESGAPFVCGVLGTAAVN